MKWSTPFIVYRLAEDAQLVEVAYPVDLNKAKYWVKYIAQPGDVCCRTPIHPKHTAAEPRPEYFSHKGERGAVVANESEWRQQVNGKGFSGSFPEEQLAEPKKI